MIAYSIIITAVLMAAVVCLGYEHIGRVKAEDAGTECMKALHEAEKLIASYQIEKANRDGVDAGKLSDTMYRNFLKQFSIGKQATVMLRRGDARYYEPKKR